ncbi:unnamed protein product, partial [Rotaria sordida]
KRIEDEEEQQQLITDGPMIIVPDHSDDEMLSDETRYEIRGFALNSTLNNSSTG